MQKTLTIDGQSVTVGLITVKAAKRAQLAAKTGEAFNDAFILAAIEAGGIADPQGLLDSLGFFTGYREVQNAALEVNGLRVPKPGESEPEAPAAA